MMEMMESKDIAFRLGMARESTGMTQQELAELIGVSPSTVTQYEGDSTGMKLETIRLIAAATLTTTGYLLGFEDMNLVQLMHLPRSGRRALWEARNANGSADPTQKALRHMAEVVMAMPSPQ